MITMNIVNRLQYDKVFRKNFIDDQVFRVAWLTKALGSPPNKAFKDAVQNVIDAFKGNFGGMYAPSFTKQQWITGTMPADYDPKSSLPCP